MNANLIISHGPRPGQPLLVCLGRGVDSYGILAGLAERGIRPAAIVFAGVGCERRQTNEQAWIFDAWVERTFGISVAEVRYEPQDFKHWPHYHTLLENCLTNVTLPSLAYGQHTCSAKWKVEAINKWLKAQPWAQEAWARGEKVCKAIGFDVDEDKRATRGCNTFAIDKSKEALICELWFPLRDWGWNRPACLQAIARQGLPEPCKSSCYFCPAMKPWEVDELEPDEWRRIVIMEARTHPRHTATAFKKAYQDGRKWARKIAKAREQMARGEARKARHTLAGWKKGQILLPGHLGPVMLRCEGLWRHPVKGMRGAAAHPGDMSSYIAAKGYLPAAEVEALQNATPTQPLKASDFRRSGLRNWDQFLGRLISTAQARASLVELARQGPAGVEAVNNLELAA